MDVFSYFTWVFHLIERSDALHVFIQFHKQIENLTEHKIKKFQSDNALEYKNFISYLNNSGIHHRFSCPHTSPQNDFAERRIIHVTESDLALLFYAHIPTSFWYESFTTTCYLLNRFPKSSSE